LIDLNFYKTLYFPILINCNTTGNEEEASLVKKGGKLTQTDLDVSYQKAKTLIKKIDAEANGGKNTMAIIKKMGTMS
jgi:hypothetical protein